ncbi:MAG: type II secretion system F family protein [Clostridia bacterium]|nr:type II secretion system F family protein [Clostridia bacterium]
MPLYTYRVQTESGKVLTGETKIDSAEKLQKLLLDRGFTPIEIKEKNFINDISQISLFKPKIKIKDIAVFCRQFAIVLEAGVPIATALDVLVEQTANPTLKDCLRDIYENIQKGTSLSAAMQQQKDTFPTILIYMVEAGEISGQLDRVFKKAADDFEKSYKLNHKIKNAFTYPVIVTVVAIIVVMVLLTFVIPTFESVLKGMGVELPLPTRILIAVSNVVKSLWWIISVGLVGVSLFLVRYLRTQNGKRFIGGLAIKLPVVKGVTKDIMTSRFTRTLATLMSSGVLLIQALEVVEKVLGNAVIADKVRDVQEEVKKGKGLTQPLTNLNYFPPMLMSMVKIGEESGELDFALNKCADFYDQEVETSLQRMTELISPAVIMVLAVIVGFILLSVLFPMFSVYQNIE